MGKAIKGLLGLPVAGAAAVQSEDAEAGWILKNGVPKVQSYHGGPEGMEEFDLRYVGTGEGNQLYSWGLYSGDDVRTGTRYKKDRQKDYDRQFQNNVYTENLDYHRHMSAEPVELRIGGAAQPLYIDIDRYADIVDEQVKRYGPNVESVNNAIQRSLTSDDLRRPTRMKNLYLDFDNVVSKRPLWNEFSTAPDPMRNDWRKTAELALREFYGDSAGDLKERIFEQLTDNYTSVDIEDINSDAWLDWYDIGLAEALKKEERFARRGALERESYTKERAKRHKEFVDAVGKDDPLAGANTPPDPDGFDFEYVKPSSFPEHLPNQIFDLNKMTEGGRKASLYEVITDARPEEVLRWDVDIRDQPQFIQDAVQKAMKNLYEATLDYPERFEGTGLNDISGWGATGLEKTHKTLKRLAEGDFDRNFNGGALIDLLSPPARTNRTGIRNGLVAPQEASLLLADTGIKGLMFPDGWTRHKPGDKSYNYVWYRDDIHQLKELGFALPMTLASMAGVGTVAAGVPLVSKEIAERFPLPQEERGYLDRVTDPETYRDALAPYMPALQFFGNNIAEGLQPLEYPARGVAAAGRAGFTLSQGGSVKEARDGLLDTLMKPYEETAQEAGDYVLKQTNSPGLATGAYMGMILADPSNYVGP